MKNDSKRNSCGNSKLDSNEKRGGEGSETKKSVLGFSDFGSKLSIGNFF